MAGGGGVGTGRDKGRVHKMVIGNISFTFWATRSYKSSNTAWGRLRTVSPNSARKNAIQLSGRELARVRAVSLFSKIRGEERKVSVWM